MSADVIEGRSRWALEQGEALALLATLPDACVDALVTDPPYSSGGAFRGDRTGSTVSKYQQTGQALQRTDFAGDNRDQRSYSYWVTLWLSECLRILKPGAPACIFTDWRQLPTTTDALQAGGFVWRGIVPWDKTEGARPSMDRFASQCEYVAWGSAGPMPEGRGVGCLPGFVRAFPKPGSKYHLAGKPVDVMREIVRICAPGGVVLDPFAGSASTGVAALAEGMQFIGFEKVGEYAAVARERLAAEERGLSVEAARAGQVSIFDAAGGVA